MTQRRSSPTVYSTFAARPAIRRSSWRTCWGFPVKPFRSGRAPRAAPKSTTWLSSALVRAWSALLRPMPELYLDACCELIKVEWLGEVVVCTELEQLHPVGGRGPRRDDDHGQRGIGPPHAVDDLLARDPGEHEVAYDEVVGERAAIGTETHERLGPGERLRAGVPISRELGGDDLVDVGVVFDDQDVRGHVGLLVRSLSQVRSLSSTNVTIPSKADSF